MNFLQGFNRNIPRSSCSCDMYRKFRSLSRQKSSHTQTASAVYRTMNVFDRKVKHLQKERAAQNDDYHLAEFIKEEVGWRTADRVFDIKRIFNNAVELGAGRGYVARHFQPDSVTKVTLCDTSLTQLDKAIVGDGVDSVKLQMDEETFDIPDNSVDLLVSSLALHWVNDLPGCLDKIMKCLKPDGVFMACVFGGDTLRELRQSLQLAENERLGGMYQHISPFTRVTDIGGLLNAAGFTLQTVDCDSLTIWYPSAHEVCRDLRLMGENNAVINRPLRINKDVYLAAMAIYDEMYGQLIPDRECRGVPATYEIINFLGWKPDPSQPQPMKRGSGEISLKDIHRIDDIVEETHKISVNDEDRK